MPNIIEQTISFEIESCLTQSKNLLLAPFKARSALKPLRIVRFP
uniref:Uncharacterized protein n=1 Tax=uncultured bacterium A1Q1_fos_4 TaxID=1256574 RepID=L7W0C0_9BACT|nr:hypothetical protein [uncultured bacterium A1Q1_fos_4]